jgi:hypothetical protein
MVEYPRQHWRLANPAPNKQTRQFDPKPAFTAITRVQIPSGTPLELMTDARHCVDCDFAGLVAATRVSFPLTNTFMELSLSPDSSVYSYESAETNFMVYRV